MFERCSTVSAANANQKPFPLFLSFESLTCNIFQNDCQSCNKIGTRWHRRFFYFVLGIENYGCERNSAFSSCGSPVVPVNARIASRSECFRLSSKPGESPAVGENFAIDFLTKYFCLFQDNNQLIFPITLKEKTKLQITSK